MTLKAPRTAAQIRSDAQRAENAQKARAAASGATRAKKTFLAEGAREQSESERKWRLFPKLINGKVILRDGNPVEVRVDMVREQLVCRYGSGEFWIVDHLLQPVRRAVLREIVDVGFSGPYKAPPADRRRAMQLQAELASKAKAEVAP